MLYRKISEYLKDYFKSGDDRILIVEGARQIGKSYIIRQIGKQIYPNFIEVNFVEDDEGPQLFKNIHSVSDFYFALSSIAGSAMHGYKDTLIFLDEIQHYPQYLTLLKFFRQDHRYRFIASGSLLGITLHKTTSVPVGSIIRKQMYQLDFEEWLIANGVGDYALKELRERYAKCESLPQEQHEHLLSLFKRYLLVGGLPDVVNEYLRSHNIAKVREMQNAIIDLYKDDAAKYEQETEKRLLIRRIYDMIPSQMENKKKRVVVTNIRDKKGDRYDYFTEEFEYLSSAGIALDVHAISDPRYPLSESLQKNLLKLYLNDVGLLTSRLFGLSIKAVLETEKSINLGAVYESVVAQELAAHGHHLFYYDNRSKGEVDYIIDDTDTCRVVPVEVKSGKDYTVHSALNNLVTHPDYQIESAVVLSNEREVMRVNKILYLPIYFVMFMHAKQQEEMDAKELIF